MTGKPCAPKRKRQSSRPPGAVVVFDRSPYLLINRACQELLHNGHLEQVEFVTMFQHPDGSLSLRPLYVAPGLVGVYRITKNRRISMGRVASPGKTFTARWNDLDEQVELKPSPTLEKASGL